MLDTIIDSLKGELGSALSDKLNLSSSDVDKTVGVAGNSLKQTISENSGGSLSGILNLFSNDNNNSEGEGVMDSLGGNLLSGLTSVFGADKGSSIKSVVLPILISVVSKKIGGNSDMLSSLLGGGGSGGGLAGAAGGLFKKSF